MNRDERALTRERLQVLVRSEKPEEREEAITHVVSLLISPDAHSRRCGYELFKEAVSEALFRSCLDYGSLAGGFTEPLVEIVTRTVECWAAGEPGRR